MKNIIKNILKEEVSKKDKLKDFIIKDLSKKFGGHLTVLFDMTTRLNDEVIPYLETTYGITPEDGDMYHDILITWRSIALRLPKIGSTIRLIRMDDPQAPPAGSLGKIIAYNPSPWGIQLRVIWENGGSLDIIPGEDEYEVLS